MRKLYALLLTAFLVISGTVIRAQVSVTATAGTLGPTAYTNLSTAFTAINAGTHQGAITVNITASFTDVATAVLNSTGAGSASYTSVLIRPSVDGVTVSFASVTGRGVIELNGADNVTIDGDNPNTGGTNRNLTITNTAANTITFNAVIRIATSAAILSADNVTVKNCIINGNATGRNAAANTSTTGSENTVFGIYAGGNGGATSTTAPTALTSVTANSAPSGTTINTFLVDNCAITACARGVVFNGGAASVSTGVTVTNNFIGDLSLPLPPTPPYTAPVTTVYSQGIWIAGANALTINSNALKSITSYVGTQLNGIEVNTLIGTGTITINNNTVNGVVNSNASAVRGIDLNSASAGATFTISGNTITNIQAVGSTTIAGLQVTTVATSGLIEKNKVTTVYSRGSGGFGSYGINLAGGSNITVQNNFVSDVNSFLNNGGLTTSFGPFGIRVASGIGHKIYNNSVNLFGSFVGSSSFTSCAAFLITSSASTGMDVRNNIFANTMTGAPAGSNVSSIFIPSGATSAMALTLNNNGYYQGAGTGAAIGQAGTTSGVGIYLAANFNPALTTPATNMRSYTSTLSVAGTNDNASFASTTAPPFLTNKNLHINQNAPNNSDVSGTGTPVGGVTNDIDGDVRNVTTPDVGADEYTVAACATSIGGAAVINGPSIFCASGVPDITATGYSNGLGSFYQWQKSNDNFVSNIVDIAGETDPSTLSAGLVTSTTYYRLKVTCPSGISIAFSNKVLVTVVNAAVGIGGSLSICPGGSTTLTENGGTATSWLWSPGGATTQAILVSPAVTTAYTVTATGAGGCFATTTVTVTVQPATTVAVLPTSNSVCSGTPTTLVASSTPQPYGVTSISYSPIPTPGSGVTTLANAATAVTPLTTGDLDDGRWDNIALPFSFNHYGAAFTSINVSTNGWIAMGNTSSTTTGYPFSLPSASAPNSIIAACAADLTGTSAGTIEYFTIGVTPSRKFVVNYTGYGFFGASGTVTAQIIMYETSNIIEIHTTSCTNTTTTKAQGIENAAGTVAHAVPGRNGVTTFTGMPDAWRFTPGTISYSWSPALGLNTTTGATVIATPASTTTYTVTATDASTGCSGTATSTITVTTAANTLISYPPGTFCQSSGPVAVTRSGTPGGTFSAVPAGLTIDPTTGTITPGTSLANTYTVNFDITASGSCPAYNTTASVKINPRPTIAIIGTSGLCGPQPFAAFGTSDTYSWSPATGLNTTIGPIVIASPTVTTTYTVTGTITLTGCTNTATASVLGTPPVPIINPNPVSICAGQIQSLTVTNAVSFPATATFTNLSFVSIPGSGTGAATGAPAIPYPSTLVVSGLPASGVTVKSVTINGITHTFPSDIDIVLQSPTGTNVILMSDVGGGNAISGVNYTFDDLAGSNLTAGANATGTYKPTNFVGGLGVEPDNWPAPGPGSVAQPTPTISSFSGNANGTWNLYIVDDAGGDVGSITGFSITFAYSTGTITWTPNTSLFTDPAATVPYVLGTLFNTVYTKAASTITYNATATIGTCSSGPTSVVVTVKPSPVISVAPNNQCAPVTLTASGNADVYTWLPITGLNTTNGPVVIASPNATTTYIATGTFNSNGCSSTASAIVKGNSQSAVLSANGVPNPVINEGFDVVPPPGWVVTNLSSPVGGTSWFQGNAAVFPSHSGAAAAYAGANFNNTGLNGTISDWLITPTVTLVNGATFSFWTRTFDGTFPDRLQLRMSTSGASTNVGTLATDVGVFTNLLVDVNPTLNNTAYPVVWTKFTVTISGIVGPTTGRFAFRYFVTDAGLFGNNSDYIGVDDVLYATPTAPTICNGQTGSLTVTVTGGNGPFSVVYSNGTTNTTVPGYTSGTPIPISPSVNTTYSLVSVTNASGCLSPGLSGTPLVTVNPLPTVTVSPNNQCGPVNLTAASTINPATFTWAPAAGLSATSGATVNANPTINTLYTVTGTVTATGCLNTASATVNATPGAPTIVPSSATICLGGPPVKLTGTPGAGSTNSVTSSGAITVAIPDASVVGATSALAVSGIPANATINSVSVNFNINHTFVSDLVINLKAPNGNILNLVDFEGGAGVNFTNTTISSASINPLAADVAPFTGTYAADRLFGFGPTGFVANVTNWSDLLSTGNGTWTLAMEDFFFLDAGTLTSWSITINYTPAVVWTPVTGLFTNPAGTTPYIAASPLSVVYANPATTTTYSASSTLGTCAGTATNVVVTVVQPPVINTQPANQTACLGTNATFSVVATSNFLNYQWQQSVNAGVTFTNIAGATNSSLVLTAVTLAMNNNQYRVIISNSCFTATSNAATLTVNPLPVVTVNALQNRICLGDTIPLVGTPVGGFWSGIGVSGFNFIASASAVGNWTLTYSYTNNNGCTNTATTVANVFDCQERIRLLSDDGVQLFPNPNNGRFFIRMNSTLYNYLGMRVYTDAGQLLRVQNFTGLGWGRVIPIDLSTFPAGVYMVKIYYDDGPRSSEKTFRVVILTH